MERYRFYPDGAIYYITFSVVEWLPVFISEPACNIIINSLNHCHDHKGLRINAYVIMPTHMHAVVFARDMNADSVKSTLTAFRKFTGRQLSDFCDQMMPACFDQVLRPFASNDRDRQFWQATLHPVQIETEAFWKVKVDYLHENPCRKGLVRRQCDWRYSSAAYWSAESPTASDVILSSIDW